VIAPTTTKAYVAIWTPWAALLCGPCHGKRTVHGEVIDTTADEREPIAKDARLATCTDCGCTVQGTSDAVYLRRLGIPGSSLEQTGGMCAGLSVTFPDGRYAFASLLDGPYVVSLNRSEEAFYDGEEPIDCFEFGSDTGWPSDADADRVRETIEQWRANR